MNDIDDAEKPQRPQIFPAELREQIKNLTAKEMEKLCNMLFEKFPEMLPAENDSSDDDIIVKCSLEEMTRAFFKDYEIIWHDPNVNSQENRQYLAELEKLCKVKVFTQWKEAEDYVKTTKTICYVITSGTNGELLVKEIFSSQNVPNIFTFCRAKDYHSTWTQGYSKILCTATKIEDVISHIQKNLLEWQKQTSSLKFDLPAFARAFDDNDKSDINHLHHYLKVIPNFHNRAQAKNDFLQLSKSVYTDKENQQLIANFEKRYDEYNKEDILKWYTRQSFVYKVINNCLRIATSDSINYCRFLLKDVEKAIQDQYQKKSKNFSGLLYRGDYLSENEWSSLKVNVNREIEMLGFLSVSKDKKIALDFVKGDPSKKVFLTIIVPKGPNEEEQGFAEVEEFSDFPKEKEVLFNVRSRFTVLETQDEYSKDFPYRHLVLFYGAQGLRKFLAIENPAQQVPIDEISGSRCQGPPSERTESILYKSLRDLTKPIYSCKGCLDPNLAPFLCVRLAEQSSTTMSVKGCLLSQTQIRWYGYQCSKFGAKNQKGYFVCSHCCQKKMKWCENCFESSLGCIENGHSVLFETSPFSFWCEKMPENELNHLKYQADLVKNNNHIFQKAQMYFETHEYDKAIEYYKIFIEQSEATGSKDVTNLATSYSNLGMVYCQQGDYDKALEYSLKALDLTKSADKENLAAAATYSNNIGLIYEKLQKDEKALEYYLESLEIFKSIHRNEPHSDLATSYNNIGLVYSRLCKDEKALENLFKSLEIEKAVYGENHPLVSASYNNIGIVYEEQEEFEKALEYYLKALAIDRLVHGEKHPDVAVSYNHIGSCYENLGEDVQAEEYYLKALGILKSIYREIHPEVAVSYKKIGGIYQVQEEDNKALEYYQKSLDIEKLVYGESHPEIAVSYSNIGSIYCGRKDYNKALEYSFKSLDIYKSIYEGNHADISTSYDNIAKIYVKQEEYKKALEYFLKALEIGKSLYGENHRKIEADFYNIAFLYDKQGEFNKALEYDLKVLDFRKRNYEEKDPRIASGYKTVGSTYEKLKEYNQAVEYYSKSLDIWKLARKENHPEVNILREKIHKINALYQDVTQNP